MIVVLGRTYSDARVAKTAYARNHPDIALAKPLSTFEPHALMGLTVSLAYVLPAARSTHSYSATAAFRLLEKALGRNGVRVDLDLLPCVCVSRCDIDEGYDCPGDDGSWDHCLGCGHRRAVKVVDMTGGRS